MPSPASSQTSLPTSPPRSQSSYFAYPVQYAVSGLLRRLSHEPTVNTSPPSNSSSTTNIWSLSQSLSDTFSDLTKPVTDANMDTLFTPPRRHLSPFQPPPLTPLSLNGYKFNTTPSGKLLSKALAEEIRLLVPPRLQLVDEWNLAYSLEQDGVSLATLYKRSEEYRGKRGGFVLVIRDGSGGVCGPYRPP